MGEYGVSASRNARLSRLLESTPYAQGYAEHGFVVENKGSGYIQMQMSLGAAGLPPAEPRDGLSTFSLTLYKRKDSPPAAGENNAQIGVLDEKDRAIIEALRSGTGVPSVKIAERVGLSRSSVLRRLDGLVAQGLAAREGSGPGTVYHVGPKA